MQVQDISLASVDGGDDKGLPFIDKSNMADQRLVYNGINCLTIIGALFGQAPDAVQWGLREIIQATFTSLMTLPAPAEKALPN